MSGCTDGLEKPQSIPRKQPVVRKLTGTDEERRRGRRKTDREGVGGGCDKEREIEGRGGEGEKEGPHTFLGPVSLTALDKVLATSAFPSSQQPSVRPSAQATHELQSLVRPQRPTERRALSSQLPCVKTLPGL